MQIVSNSTVAAENCALPPARPNKETTFVNVTGNRTKRDFWETDDTAVTPIFVGAPNTATQWQSISVTRLGVSSASIESRTEVG